MENKKNIDELLVDYYKEYYKNQLGLPDYKDRIKLRLNEEGDFCSRFINWIEEWINYDFSNKKILVVGCGTGGELVTLKERGANVFGIEPNKDALDICHLKAKEHSIPKGNIVLGFSESLPFKNGEFDFIYCFTVLEHVNDVDLSVKEMVRCAKVGGKVFIETPDYRQLYEGHYKLPLPMFLPIWFNKIILILLGRPTGFIDTINKVNSRGLYKIFKTLPVDSIRVYKSIQSDKIKRKSSVSNLIKSIQNLIFNVFGVQINQIWVLHKSSDS
jgi:2-polyprenyl-3-methyl-5-hydroxy-6-metoxy-1,4-benzoquinol methylase